MNKENCALKLVDEIILYYDARSKKHQMTLLVGLRHIVLHCLKYCELNVNIKQPLKF